MANAGLFATNQFATKSETTDCEQAEGMYTRRRERETLTDRPLKKSHSHTASPCGHFSLGPLFTHWTRQHSLPSKQCQLLLESRHPKGKLNACLAWVQRLLVCQENRGANRGCRVRWRHSSRGLGKQGGFEPPITENPVCQEEGNVLGSWKPGTSKKPCYTGHRDEGKAT